jgi:hypothetical protein
VKIETLGQTVEFLVENDSSEYNPRTQYWKKIHSDGGKINFDKAGEYTLSLEPLKLSDGNLGFTFHSINLIPVNQ